MEPVFSSVQWHHFHGHHSSVSGWDICSWHHALRVPAWDHITSPRQVRVKVAQLCLTLCDPMDCPWNSPGQNTGVDSLSLLQGIVPTQGLNPDLLHHKQILYHLSDREVLVFLWKSKWKLLSRVWFFSTPWNSLGQNTGVDSLSLLQGVFLTQGSNPGLPHCRQILYQLRHKGSPHISLVH